MAAQVVYSVAGATAALSGSLFAEKVFWIAARTPSRAHFARLVEANGGSVTTLEKNADYLICDHLRKDNPPGAISYRFIEDSVKTGQIPNPSTYTCAPPQGTAREVGAVTLGRSSRIPYTAQDDRMLYKWVKDSEAKGSSVLGNQIYMQLEAVNNRHPWQSWRDRYVKKLQFKAPESWENFILEEHEKNRRSSTPPSKVRPAKFDTSREKTPPDPDQQSRNEPHIQEGTDDERPRPRTASPEIASTPDMLGFTASNFTDLLMGYDEIATTTYAEFVKAFNDWAASREGPTSEEWQDFFQHTVARFHQKYLKDAAKELQYKIKEAIQAYTNQNPQHSVEVFMKVWRQTLRPALQQQKPREASAVTDVSQDSKQSIYSSENHFDGSMDGAVTSRLTPRTPPLKRGFDDDESEDERDVKKRIKIEIPFTVRQVQTAEVSSASEDPNTASIKDSSIEVPQSYTSSPSVAGSESSSGLSAAEQERASQQLLSEVQESTQFSITEDLPPDTPEEIQETALGQGASQTSPTEQHVGQSPTVLAAGEVRREFDTQMSEFEMPEPEGGFEGSSPIYYDEGHQSSSLAVGDGVDINSQQPVAESIDHPTRLSVTIDSSNVVTDPSSLTMSSRPSQVNNSYSLEDREAEQVVENEVQELQLSQFAEDSDHLAEYASHSDRAFLSVAGNPQSQTEHALPVDPGQQDHNYSQFETKQSQVLGAVDADDSQVPNPPHDAASPVVITIEETLSSSSSADSESENEHESTAMQNVTAELPAASATPITQIDQHKQQQTIEEDDGEDSDPNNDEEPTTTSFAETLSNLKEAGYTDDQIRTAIFASNGSTSLLPRLVEALRRGNGLPAGEAGVWTEQDDKELEVAMEEMEETGEEEELDGNLRLIVKHGREEVRRRVEFLRLVNGEE